MFNNFTKTCADKPCPYLTQEQCYAFSDRCMYQRGDSTTTGSNANGHCMKRPCEQLAQRALCGLDRNCEWEDNVCVTVRVNLPCAERQMSDCVMPECLPDAIARDVCAPAPCRRYGRNATLCRLNSDRCAFNVSGSETCDEMPCRGMDASVCNQSSRCMWWSEQDTCGPKPCGQLSGADCDLQRCDVSSTGQCKAIVCSEIRERDACPPVECQWMGGVCATGVCQWATGADECSAAGNACAWVSAAGRCVPQRFVTQVACQSYASAAWCGAASERCEWTMSSTTAGTTAQGWCAPKQTDAPQMPCYAYTTKGEAGCPTAQNCMWMYDSLCMNPLCARLGDNATKCQMARCLFQTASDGATSPEA